MGLSTPPLRASRERTTSETPIFSQCNYIFLNEKRCFKSPPRHEGDLFFKHLANCPHANSSRQTPSHFQLLLIISTPRRGFFAPARCPSPSRAFLRGCSDLMAL